MSFLQKSLILNLLILFMVLLGGGQAIGATPLPDEPRWLPFTPGGEPSSPSVSVTDASPTAIDLQAHIPGVYVATREVNGALYTWIGGDDFGHRTEVGLPDLPVLRRSVEIPFGAQIRLEVLSAEYTEYDMATLGIRHPILPLQPPLPKCAVPQENPAIPRPTVYQEDAFFPSGIVLSTREYIVRGHRALAVEIWPMTYHPVSGRVRLYSDVRFRIHLTGSDMARTREMARRYASPAFERWLAGSLLNYHQSQPAPYDLRKTPVGYLIIVADAYYNGMLPFVTLKQNQGFTVTMVRTSEIPGGATTIAIQAYIQNAYHNWPIPPSYILLVGDTDTIPAWTGPVIGTATDLYYATMDATGTGEWHPDIGYGRFPVRSAAQTAIMVNKYLAYASLSGEEPWLKRASFPASCDSYYYGVAEGTHNYVISTHTQPRGYTGIFPNNPQPGGDKLYCITYGAQYANLVNAFNQGRWVIVYSGHGDYSGWEMSFGSSAVRNLTNYGMFPFVASHACLTGNFGQTEVFGETWVLQENKGALAYFGSSTYSYWGEDDVLERRAFDALFGAAYPDLSLAGMAAAGLSAVERSYPGRARYYWETYNILGDPSLRLFPSQPLLPYLNVWKTASTDPAEAGTQLRYTLTISNTGGPATAVVVTDTLPANTVFAAASDGGTLVGDQVVWDDLSVEANASRTLRLDVVVTCVPSGTLIVNDAYTVTAQDWPTPTTELPVTVTVWSSGIVPDFSYSPNPAVLNWPVNFTNRSRNATAYQWDFGDGLTATVSSPSHTYTALGSYTVVLTATSLCHTATASQTLQVENYAVMASPPSAVGNGNPGETVTYTLWITNEGTLTDTFALSRSGNAWTTTFSRTSLTLASGEGEEVDVYVTVPDNAMGGAQDWASVRVWSLSDPRSPAALASAVLTTTANTIHSVAVSALTPPRSAYPGEVVTYTLRVTNTGNAVDTITFHRTTTGWPTVIAPPQLTIARGGWRTVGVTVTVPPTAVDGEQDEAIIEARGSGDSAPITLTTTAVWRKVYLPLMLRRYGP